MRKMMAAGLVAICGMLACVPARADWSLPSLAWVPPFKGNDTGGIIAYSLAKQQDARQLAVEHCAYYGKVAKFLAVQYQEGGYISFACRWVPWPANAQHHRVSRPPAARPLVTKY